MCLCYVSSYKYWKYILCIYIFDRLPFAMGCVPTFFNAFISQMTALLQLTKFLWWPCTSSSDGVLTREVLATAPFSIGSLLKQFGLDLSQPVYYIHQGLVKILWQSKKSHFSMHTNEHPLHVTKCRQCFSKNIESQSCI